MLEFGIEKAHELHSKPCYCKHSMGQHDKICPVYREFQEALQNDFKEDNDDDYGGFDSDDDMDDDDLLGDMEDDDPDEKVGFMCCC